MNRLEQILKDHIGDGFDKVAEKLLNENTIESLLKVYTKGSDKYKPIASRMLVEHGLDLDLLLKNGYDGITYLEGRIYISQQQLPKPLSMYRAPGMYSNPGMNTLPRF